jgi:hypothetical protein
MRFALVVGSVWIASTAHAQPSELPQTLSLSVSPCEAAPLSWQRVVSHLEIELREAGTRVVPSLGALQVMVDVPGCAPDATVAHVLLVSRESGRSITTDVTIGSLDPRELALAIVELVRDRWHDLDPPIDTGVSETARLAARQVELEQRIASIASAQDEARRAARTERDGTAAELARIERSARELAATREPSIAAPGLFVEVALGVEAFPSSGGALASLGAATDIPLDPFRLRFRGQVALSERAIEPGDVFYVSLQGSVSLLSPFTSGRVGVAAGPTATFGWLHASGSTDGVLYSGASADVPIGWAGVEVVLAALVTAGVRLVAALEVAHTFLAFDGLADDQPVAPLGGPMIAARIGGAFEP